MSRRGGPPAAHRPSRAGEPHEGFRPRSSSARTSGATHCADSGSPEEDYAPQRDARPVGGQRAGRHPAIRLPHGPDIHAAPTRSAFPSTWEELPATCLVEAAIHRRMSAVGP
ncbi:MAG: hypothetical protein U5R31_03525 [Acidimicrobiia bacterium]|nr:hypothetical protein [Acidimicrobiia bacterium]